MDYTRLKSMRGILSLGWSFRLSCQNMSHHFKILIPLKNNIMNGEIKKGNAHLDIFLSFPEKEMKYFTDK